METRPLLIERVSETKVADITPCVTPYTIEAGLGNVENTWQFYLTDEEKKKIEQNGIKNIHCSIDIDAMDPSIVSATGTPVPNGLQNLDYDIFINELFAKINIVSCDFVEFNPLLQGKELTFEWCKRALCLISEKL